MRPINLSEPLCTNVRHRVLKGIRARIGYCAWFDLEYKLTRPLHRATMDTRIVFHDACNRVFSTMKSG